MAARPNKAIAGSDPLTDLLFSPRAAFVWDHTASAIAWMNAGARSKFGLDTEELPPRLAARLAQCFDAAQGNGKAVSAVKFKAGHHPAISCSFEVIELAGGHRGLIVSEAASAQEPPNVVRLPAPAKKKTAAKPQAAPERQRAPSKPTPACQLTPEELRAFKSIGRTVRRLAREKECCAGAPEAVCAPPPRQSHPAGGSQATPDLLLSAFDLVLFLGTDFAVCRSEGRPQHVGWRKSKLMGKSAETVLPLAEQAIFRRMIKKLNAGAKICRDTLVVSNEAGGSVPCRAILGRWPDGNAHYFLALLSLSVPARLKRQPALPQITRLAA
ncbi:MAG: hypothetical protein ACLPX9_19540 [Rhodomicrobium sp.]